MIANVKSIVHLVIQIKNGAYKICECECKNYRKCEKDYNWNPSTCICENGKYLKSIADTSVTEFYEIVTVLDNV